MKNEADVKQKMAEKNYLPCADVQDNLTQEHFDFHVEKFLFQANLTPTQRATIKKSLKNSDGDDLKVSQTVQMNTLLRMLELQPKLEVSDKFSLAKARKDVTEKEMAYAKQDDQKMSDAMNMADLEELKSEISSQLFLMSLMNDIMPSSLSDLGSPLALFDEADMAKGLDIEELLLLGILGALTDLEKELEEAEAKKTEEPESKDEPKDDAIAAWTSMPTANPLFDMFRLGSLSSSDSDETESSYDVDSDNENSNDSDVEESSKAKNRKLS